MYQTGAGSDRVGAASVFGHNSKKVWTCFNAMAFLEDTESFVYIFST